MPAKKTVKKPAKKTTKKTKTKSAKKINKIDQLVNLCGHLLDMSHVLAGGIVRLYMCSAMGQEDYEKLTTQIATSMYKFEKGKEELN